MNTYKRLALVALLFIFSLSAYAQDRGIWGRVTSVNTGSEGIMVLLLNSGDSSVIRTAATDSSGDYYMDAPPPGKYFVMATGMGYEHYYGQVFNFDGSNYHYPDIELRQNARELNEVSVTYTKPMIERKADRIIINTGKMISASGSSVFDMLKKLPGIRITSDDAISMNNKDGILVLIDNRNTNLAMADIISLMKSLPASEIDKVELIFNPPARYDAAGNAGIINLVTKKGVKDGFNGTLTAAYL
ncbi:MAG: TonB-dependent receptor, partial [Taibaiella sp.]|nr:TonB-dependent receptor [Taibaiella sp.]